MRQRCQRPSLWHHVAMALLQALSSLGNPSRSTNETVELELASSISSRHRWGCRKATWHSNSTVPPDHHDTSPPTWSVPLSPQPPQGFRLASRVVTSPSDGLSVFLDSDNLLLPYTQLQFQSLVESLVESTSDAFQLSHLQLTQFPAATQMKHWINLAGQFTLDDDLPPLNDGQTALLLPLDPLEITVSGEGQETRTFVPGDVVWMEDTWGKGHKMRAVTGAQGRRSHQWTVLMLTLPHTVRPSFLQQSRHESSSPFPIHSHHHHDRHAYKKRFQPSVRRVLLAAIGLAVTTSMAYCVQLLYPPLFALGGGATIAMGGAWLFVWGARWLGRQWRENGEEWRYRYTRNRIQTTNSREYRVTLSTTDAAEHTGENESDTVREDTFVIPVDVPVDEVEEMVNESLGV